jgi:hypothetical protein
MDGGNFENFHPEFPDKRIHFCESYRQVGQIIDHSLLLAPPARGPLILLICMLSLDDFHGPVLTL